VRDCARCGAPLRYGHVLNAIAGAADPDDNGKDDGLVSCVCGAVHTPVAPFLLGLVFLGGSAAGAFGSLWLFADLLDRAIESWSSYWQGAALLAVFAVPSLLVMALVSLVWPLRFVEMRRRPREPAGPTPASLFEASLVLGFCGVGLGVVDGFGPLTYFVLAVAAACFWMSLRPRGRKRAPRPS
jgi:hypothetical protein